jgi:hypothetical protein
MDTVDTVKIKHDKVPGNTSGYCIINRADYDPKKHELYEEEQPAGKDEKDKGASKTKDKDKPAGKDEK